MDGEASARRRRGNGAWEIVLVRPDPTTTAWPNRYVKLFLLWSAAVAVSVALFVFAGYVWGSLATAAFLVAGCWLTCCYLKAAPPPELPVDGSTVPAMVVGQVNGGGGGGGLSQAEIEAIPVFEYRRRKKAAAAAVEQCAVCINVVRDGEAVRRLSACAHTFHSPCIDGWLRVHATCPMCRADVKVAAVGLPAAESSAA